MLTQGNFVSNVLAGCSLLPFDSTAVTLSFLPLSHVFERLIEYCYYHVAPPSPSPSRSTSCATTSAR